MGDKNMALALQPFDRLYQQNNKESPLQQLQVQLANALPYDLEETELSEYKNLDPRWHDWQAVKAVCTHLSTVIFDRVCDMQTERSADNEIETKQKPLASNPTGRTQPTSSYQQCRSRQRGLDR